MSIISLEGNNFLINGHVVSRRRKLWAFTMAEEVVVINDWSGGATQAGLTASNQLQSTLFLSIQR